MKNTKYVKYTRERTQPYPYRNPNTFSIYSIQIKHKSTQEYKRGYKRAHSSTQSTQMTYTMYINEVYNVHK